MIDLLVIYTERLDDCRNWYTDTLGLAFAREQHGTGPVHYAATMPDGAVIELYPAGPKLPTGRIRLGLTLLATPRYPAGQRRLTDPDGRTVVLTTETRR